MYQPIDVHAPWGAARGPAPWVGPGPAPSRQEVDDRLIASVLQGRTDAFGDLIEPHLGSLTRFARMRLRNDAEAEDVVQQAVLRAFYNLARFRREASFKTWLSKITFNEVIHVRRGRAVAPLRPLYDSGAGKLADPACAPDVQIQRRQEIEKLRSALTRLPEKYRSVIELRDLHELSIAATARSLSLSTAAVKTRHHRARKLLLRSLGGFKRT
jgi:RNA polymerase sigma-70 factor (ECF subfamily)